MPFVIAAGTTITGFGTSTGIGLPNQIGSGDRGIESISFSTGVTPNRLFHLGYITPYDQNVTVQKQLTITCYGGASNLYSTLASSDCTEPDPLSIILSTSSCDGQSFLDETDWFVQSYSYNKDLQGFGRETWTLTSRPLYLDENYNEVTDVEIRMIRGIAQGEKTTDGGADPGIVFQLDSIVDETTVPALGFVGDMQVSAGSPGIGRANDKQYGVVTQVGQGTGKSDGRDGSGSVQVPYSPITIPTL
jgi:hypothetical protein